jgi:transketolase
MSSNSLREAFGEAIAHSAEAHSDIVVLDADVAGGTGTHHVRTHRPEQFIQCGIAEQNMVGVAAGLAQTGLKPFVTTFAVFMLRAFEQIRLSVAYSNANVKLVASHPGLDVGPDGASAQCLEDLACMRSLPNMTVLSPCDALEVSAATKTLVEHTGPVYMRTGRSPCPNVFEQAPKFEIGKGMCLQDGSDLTLISTGVMTHRALVAANELQNKGMSVRVVHMPTIKPLDKNMVAESAAQTKAIFTCEDHSIIGGLGGAVAEILNTPLASAPLFRIGVRDEIGRSGEPDELAQLYGLDVAGIVEYVTRAMQNT